jgi:hypothetical protein
VPSACTEALISTSDKKTIFRIKSSKMSECRITLLCVSLSDEYAYFKFRTIHY